MKRRLEHELDIIIPKGYASYFLVVADIVALSEINCGRGSAAASLVSYLLGITHVDPIQHNLFFERFLNRERKDPPDIDIDFPWDERDEVLDYIFSKYQGHIAMVANHNFLRGRSALRKVLGKKHKEKRLRHLKERFYQGAEQRGVKIQIIDKIWEMIQSFSGYSFCKPHSASYCMVSMKACFLKAHYPAAFMAAVISNRGGFYNTAAYLEEARRMGITVLPPDVNDSEYAFFGEGKWLRTGLMQLKGLKESCIETLLSERKSGGRFSSLRDFLERVDPDFSDARLLLKARAFGSLRRCEGKKRSLNSMMWEIYLYRAQKKGLVKGECRLPELPGDYDPKLLVQWEGEFLQGMVTFPSWMLYRDVISHTDVALGSELYRYVGDTITLFGRKVTSKYVRTKKGEAMSFVSFSDDTAIYETVFFPEAYATYRDILHLGGHFLLQGVVQSEMGALHVQVRGLKRLPERDRNQRALLSSQVGQKF